MPPKIKIKVISHKHKYKNFRKISEIYCGTILTDFLLNLKINEKSIKIQSYIWSSDVPTNWSGGAGSASRCDPFSAMSSGLSLAIGSAMLAGAEGPVGPLFLLGGLLGGSISAAGSGCFG